MTEVAYYITSLNLVMLHKIRAGRLSPDERHAFLFPRIRAELTRPAISGIKKGDAELFRRLLGHSHEETGDVEDYIFVLRHFGVARATELLGKIRLDLIRAKSLTVPGASRTKRASLNLLRAAGGNTGLISQYGGAAHDIVSSMLRQVEFWHDALTDRRVAQRLLHNVASSSHVQYYDELRDIFKQVHGGQSPKP